MGILTGSRPELAPSPAVEWRDRMVEALRVPVIHAKCSEQRLAGVSTQDTRALCWMGSHKEATKRRGGGAGERASTHEVVSLGWKGGWGEVGRRASWTGGADQSKGLEGRDYSQSIYKATDR